MTVATDELRSQLEQSLAEAPQSQAGIVAIERRPSLYQTSFPLEDVDVVLDNGGTLALVLKDLSPGGLSERARAAKPSFLIDPERELEAYRGPLAGAGLGTPRCYAAVSDAAASRFWLLIERIDGVPLWQVGEPETWQAAARWLAVLHERFSADRGWREASGHLIDYDADYYGVWAERARQSAATPGLRRRDRERIAAIASSYEQQIEPLAALPTTFIHGEFYASNVLVDEASGPSATAPRISPIDWEMAAAGPGLVDLAALSTGKWSEAERAGIVSAYRQALGPSAGATEDDWERALDCCALHLAVRWLGWAPGWRAPRAHRHDWLREASEIVERLER